MKTGIRRKVLSSILVALMLIGSVSITGCGSNDAKQAVEDTTTAATEMTEEKGEVSESETTEQTETTKETTQATQTKAKETQKKATTKKSTKAQTKATTAASVCSVSVDGYCSNKKVTVASGDTAYSVLKKTGASVSSRNSQFGLYVEGINGRFEFDEGDTSGWKYSVNGSTPNKSCDKITIKSGDKVKWYYVK